MSLVLGLLVVIVFVYSSGATCSETRTDVQFRGGGLLARVEFRRRRRIQELIKEDLDGDYGNMNIEIFSQQLTR